jgi:cytochrome c-type biogenesis protein CcmH
MAVILTLSLMPARAVADVESEARVIDAMLIAPCCFRQQVSVHQSPAADEVRVDVRARVAAGETRQQILDSYVVRYGTRILVAPPAVGFDRSLYVMPFITLVLSAGVVAAVLRRFTRRRTLPTPESGDAGARVPAGREEEARLDDELRDLD